MISPYATALFDLAAADNKVDEYDDLLKDLVVILQENPEFMLLMDHPGLDKEEKMKRISEAFGFLDQTLYFFFKILIEDHQMKEARQILEDFCELADQSRGIETAYVSSAIPLSQKEMDELQKALEKKHNKKIKVKVSVEPELLGGLRVQIGEEITDQTLKHKLLRLKDQLS